MGFIAGQALQIGAILRFSTVWSGLHASRAEVRSCRLRADGRFAIGARFC